MHIRLPRGIIHTQLPAIGRDWLAGSRRNRLIWKLVVTQIAHVFMKRVAFISVGSVCQRLRLVGSWSVLRSLFAAAGRVDSSLRSHRTWRSYCRRVCSGLNKTLFASVEPNSLCRSHQPTLPARPGSPGIVATFIVFLQERCLLGRMK